MSKIRKVRENEKEGKVATLQKQLIAYESELGKMAPDKKISKEGHSRTMLENTVKNLKHQIELYSKPKEND